MEKENFLKYAPWLAVALAFFMQYNLFVTPAQLKDAQIDILTKVDQKYATKETGADLKNQLGNMQFKIDEIYKIISKKGGF